MGMEIKGRKNEMKVIMNEETQTKEKGISSNPIINKVLFFYLKKIK